MKSSFCIDLQRFMLIPTKFPLSPKVGNEEYDTVSYNVDYYDVKRFDDGELTIHELVNSAFDPAEQVNAKQAALLGAVFVAAMGGPAQARVGTGGGGSNSHSPWNDKDKRKNVRR